MDGYYEFPPHIEPKARDLIKSFLCADRSVRLGCNKVRNHYFFKYLIRTDQMTSRRTNGLEESIGMECSQERSHLPGFQKLETLLTLSTLIGMQNQLKHQVCQPKSNKSTLLTFEVNEAHNYIYAYLSIYS